MVNKEKLRQIILEEINVHQLEELLGFGKKKKEPKHWEKKPGKRLAQSKELSDVGISQAAVSSRTSKKQQLADIGRRICVGDNCPDAGPPGAPAPVWPRQVPLGGMRCLRRR